MLQFEEPAGTEEFLGVSSIQVEMTLNFLQSKHDIYVLPFCPLLNLSLKFFLLFCILFFYMPLLTMFSFYKIFGYIFP